MSQNFDIPKQMFAIVTTGNGGFDKLSHKIVNTPETIPPSLSLVHVMLDTARPQCAEALARPGHGHGNSTPRRQGGRPRQRPRAQATAAARVAAKATPFAESRPSWRRGRAQDLKPRS